MPPQGAVVWTRAQRDAWEAAPERAAERAAWEATRPPPAPPRAPRIMRALAFIDRLPFVRQAEIVAAARTLATQGNAVPDLLLTRIGAASVVDLDDPQVSQGVAELRRLGLITPAEADALMADPRPEEMP